MKINDVNKGINSVPQGTTAVNRIFGGNTFVRPEQMNSGVTQAKGRTGFEIPINLIKAREVNNYAITGIDELADSIKRTGLWQPIIVRKNPEDSSRYIIVAGERRYTAVKRLHDAAERNKENANEKLFSTIAAYILSADEIGKEEAIYSETNDYSRQITNFERILRLDPESIDLNNPETKQEYLSLCFDKDVDPEAVVNRGSAAEKSKYISAVLNHKYPDLDISEATVRAYLIFIDRCSSSLLHAILKGVISLRDARGSISYLSEEDQEAAIMAAGTIAYEDFIRKGQEISEASKNPVTEKTKEPEDLIVSAGKISKKLYSTRNDFEKIYNDTTYRRDLDENQKDYIGKLRQAMSAIEALKTAEEKLKR